MPHPLDRPAWYALTTRQAHLAQGEGRARRYRADHAIFAATEDESPEAVIDLAALIRATGPAI